MFTFNLFVTHSQIFIYDLLIENIDNEWTDRHVNQGFSYKEGCIGLGTSIDGGECLFNIKINTAYKINPSSTDVLILPFNLKNNKGINIGTVCEDYHIKLQKGSYELYYEVGLLSEDKMFCNIFLNESSHVEPKIIKLQPQYKPVYPLLMTSKEA